MTANSPPDYLKDRYRLIEHLGSGGMATVYRAHDESLDRDVAIKFLPPAQISEEDSARFLREARTVARLSHPNIMLLYDMGREAEWHYLVLEYIPGTNLHRLMVRQKAALSVPDALRIIRETLTALAYAHAQGLVHRDIKPDNIMLTPDGQVKVTDFGLALAKGDVRLTETDAIVGTALYMAPETASDGIIDARADLYAVGAVFYELLTGRPPFTGETPLQVLTAALNAPLTRPRLVNPGIPEALEHIVVRLLAKNPDERYASANDVLDALPEMNEVEALLNEAVKRATSERLSRSLLERIVRSSSTMERPEIDAESDTEDVLIAVTDTGEPAPLSQDLLVYAAQEDTIEAVEAERRRMARMLNETVVSQLNLLLSQASAYEQTINNPQARMAISVLSTLARQVVQQARDLETTFHPTILESLGLEPALESLASQEMRARGLHITLALQRMRERLPYPLELALFRASQDTIDRAVRQANASQIGIRLEKNQDMIFFSVTDNGFPPSGDILHHTRQRIEGLGGVMEYQQSRQGGLDIQIRFLLEAPVELTEREMDVIALVAEGLSNKEIASLLYVSPRTVKFHLDNIYSKLGVNTRTEAAIYALRRGWIRQHSAQTD